MNLQWIDIDYFLDKYQEYKASQDSNARRVCNGLFNRFPTPEDWINASVEEKIKYPFPEESFSEYQYLIAFIWDKKLYEDLSLRPILIEYLLHPSNAGRKSLTFLVRSQGLLLDNEFELLPNIYSRPVAILCLLLGKAFKDLADDDLKSIPEIYKGNTTPKKIQDIRIKLRYSSTIIKHMGKGTKWDKLIAIPSLGDVFKTYKEFLICSDATSKYLATQITPLTYLYNYITRSGHKDFTHFTSTEFVNLTEAVRNEKKDGTALHYVSSIKRFFEWGTVANEEFPKVLDFPSSYWSELLRAEKKRRKESDGRAFSEQNLAGDIIKTVHAYEPQTDTEYVCRALWLIVGSCPSRLQFLLDLEADSSLKPLPNEPDTLAVYSKFADKAGNEYGQFPILDKIGVDAIEGLQKRAIELGLKPIKNDNNGEAYVHLFQLTETPWRPLKHVFYNFYLEKIQPQIKELYPNIDSTERYKVNVHGFRHHLLTLVGFATGDIEVVQTAAGHRDTKMTKEYLKSKVSKQALLYRVVDKYEKQELSGKFYLRLVELLTTENIDVDELFTALSSEMTMDEFILAYGKKLDIGYCFGTSHCSNWLKCWGCTNFMMTKEEINQAINTLARLIISIKNSQKACVNFTFEHPLINTQIKTITLIVKRLTELGISQEQVVDMYNNLIHKKDLMKGVIIGAS